MANYYVVALRQPLQRCGHAMLGSLFRSRHTAPLLLADAATAQGAAVGNGNGSGSGGFVGELSYGLDVDSLSRTMAFLAAPLSSPATLAESTAELVEALSNPDRVASAVTAAVSSPIASHSPSPTAVAATSSADTDVAASLTVEKLGENFATNQAFLAQSFIRLLQSPFRLDRPAPPPPLSSSSPEALDGLPESLLLDGARLAAIRDRIDSITVIAATTIALRQLLSSRTLTAPATPAQTTAGTGADITASASTSSSSSGSSSSAVALNKTVTASSSSSGGLVVSPTPEEVDEFQDRLRVLIEDPSVS